MTSCDREQVSKLPEYCSCLWRNQPGGLTLGSRDRKHFYLHRRSMAGKEQMGRKAVSEEEALEGLEDWPTLQSL